MEILQILHILWVGMSFFVFELGFGFSDIGMTTAEILKVFYKGQDYLMRELCT